MSGDEYQFTGQVECAPQFTTWVNVNQAKLDKWKNNPFFLTDNPDFSGFSGNS